MPTRDRHLIAPQPQESLHLSASVKESFGYYLLRSMLPLGVIACPSSALIVWLSDIRGAGIIASYVLAIMPIYLFLLLWYLPKVDRHSQLDLLAAVSFVLAEIGNWLGAFVARMDASPLSSGILIVMAAFAFSRSAAYASYVAVAMLGQVASRYLSAEGFSTAYYYFISLTPLYALIARWSVSRLQSTILTTNRLLQNKVDELEAEKKLRQESEKQLRHAQKMEGLGLLAAGIAHDFNNYLQRIQSITELWNLHSARNDYAGLIEKTTGEAAHVCSRMLAYAGKSQEKQCVFDLVEMIRNAKEIFDVSIPKQVETCYQLPTQPIYVLANSVQLQQCLNNLVQNALESASSRPLQVRISVTTNDLSQIATEPGWRDFGDLHSEAAPHQQIAVIEVSDNGSGMSDAVLDSAFDPYFTTKSGGHGFGLSTTLGLIRSFEGYIRCRTSEGQGTSLQIILPKTQPKPPAELPGHRPESPTKIRRVLLAEDDASIRQSMEDLLRQYGFEVEAVASGAEAIECLRKKVEFDVLVADYSMPKKTGLELIEAIRSEGRNLPTILCSGYAEELVETRTSCKPDFYLSKPYRIDQLIEAFGKVSGARP